MNAMPVNEDLWYEDGIDVREDEHDELTDEDFDILYQMEQEGAFI